jgi:hypothetical protein
MRNDKRVKVRELKEKLSHLAKQAEVKQTSPIQK